jgi:hypothetical protein
MLKNWIDEQNSTELMSVADKFYEFFIYLNQQPESQWHDEVS